MSNQLYIENKGKDIQLKRGGAGVDYFKVMTNNTSSFLTICFATFYNCKWGGGGGGGGRSLFKPNLTTSIPNPPPQKKKICYILQADELITPTTQMHVHGII